jgi:putative hydrolase of the HAD superfamily
MKDEIKTIFFDLDHTLWDFESNSTEALLDLIDENNIHSRMTGEVDTFIQRYKQINHVYWEAYRKGEMEKSELRIGRFRDSLSEFGIDDPNVHEKFAQGYIQISPEKTNLFPHAIETLEYLSEKYPIFIITNGFEEVQRRKIRNCGMEKYFKAVITSEMAGFSQSHCIAENIEMWFSHTCHF